MTFIPDKGIIMPLRTIRTYEKQSRLTPLTVEIVDKLIACEVGDSFLVSGTLKGTAIRSGIAAKYISMKSDVRDMGNGTIRIWRTA